MNAPDGSLAPSTAALEDSLRRLESVSAVGQLALALVHQMRTPLHVIQSNVELLRERQIPGDADALDMVERNTGRILSLIDALRAYAEPSPAVYAPGDVSAVLERACVLAEAACKKQRVRLLKEFSPLPPAAVDADHLLGAFYALLANAVDAMPEGGTLSVRAAPSQGGIRVGIEDTGLGMDASQLAQAGRPFYTTKNGAGLGLYLARAVLERHHAPMTLESEKGKGTRASITFPAISK